MLMMTEILKQHLNFLKTLYVEVRARAANFTSSDPRGWIMKVFDKYV